MAEDDKAPCADHSDLSLPPLPILHNNLFDESMESGDPSSVPHSSRLVSHHNIAHNTVNEEHLKTAQLSMFADDDLTAVQTGISPIAQEFLATTLQASHPPASSNSPIIPDPSQTSFQDLDYTKEISSQLLLIPMNNATNDDASRFDFNKLPPELRVHVHSFLAGDLGTLFNAIQVNHEWFNDLVDHIWHEPGFGALLCPAEGRRQFYADKIRVFRLDHDPAGRVGRLLVHWRDVLSTIRIPYLKKLRIIGGAPPDEYLCPLLQPSLLSVELPYDLSLHARESLKACTRLQHLACKETVEISDLGSFMDFVDDHSCLRSIEFGADILSGNPFTEHTNDVFAKLLDHNRFSKLVLGKELERADAAEITGMLKKPGNLNRNLEILKISGHTDALMFLLPRATSALRILQLTFVEGHDGAILRSLSRYSNLVELRMSLCPADVLSLEEFDTLACLPRLKALDIAGRWKAEERPDLDWLTDQYFEEWITNFPNLYELSLSFTNDDLTEASVAAISRNCPNLESLTLGWKQDLKRWKTYADNMPILFPHLNQLGLRDIEDQEQKRVSAESQSEAGMTVQALSYMELIYEFAPRLERIVVLSNSGASDVMFAMRAAIETITRFKCVDEDNLEWQFSKEQILDYKRNQLGEYQADLLRLKEE